MDAKQYDEAISQYTTALSLNPATPRDLLCKRSKAHAGKGEWVDALNDAEEVTHIKSLKFLYADGCYSGNKARFVFSIGLREEARGFTWRWTF